MIQPARQEVTGTRTMPRRFFQTTRLRWSSCRQRVVETMRWGFPPPPGVASKVNVRNAASAYWRPSIANKAQGCIVPATAFAEPDRNTSKPVVIR